MLDSYLYPGTETLGNKFRIKDAEKLQDLEAALFRLQISEPLPVGDFDYNRLKSITAISSGNFTNGLGKKEAWILSKDKAILHVKNLSRLS